MSRRKPIRSLLKFHEKGQPKADFGPIVADIDLRRIDAGLSVAALCAAAGVTERTWYHLRRGRHAPLPRTLSKLRRALHRLQAEVVP